MPRSVLVFSQVIPADYPFAERIFRAATQGLRSQSHPGAEVKRVQHTSPLVEGALDGEQADRCRVVCKGTVYRRSLQCLYGLFVVARDRRKVDRIERAAAWVVDE